jgi:O-glycosyl hydrolase
MTIEAMRFIAFFASLAVGASVCAQQAVQLPPPASTAAPAADTFRFVSDGPAGPGWSRPDEIARKYFHENLTALFERTLTLDSAIPQRATLRWIFTGPRAGLTVELTSSKVRIAERYYDSMALYEGQGNFPEKTTFADERQYTGDARSLTVIADAHLAVRVLINGQQILEAPMLFDLTRHQLMLAASRTAHEVVSGSLVKPDIKSSTITVNPAEFHQTMLGFGGSPSIAAYTELSDEGKHAYWQILKRYNLLLFREYPMGTQLKPDMSNLENPADATPHYYGDNFPNSELSSFDYSRHVLDLGGSVIYELWALPSWATVPNSGPHATDTWNKPIKQVANPDQYARLIVTYCQKAKAATGSAPAIVGIENEVDQPTEVFSAMALALRRELDKAGFTSTKIHMADASYMFLGVDRARELRKNPEAWKVIDYAAVHEYDFQEFLANPDLYDARMKQMHEAADGKPFLATEICINDPHFQEPSYRIAFAVAQLYHKNLTELDAVALMYCWLLLDVEQPTFAGSRSLLAPDRTRGWIPVPTSYQLRVMGAFSRHVLKGMQRIGVETGDPDLLATGFADGQNQTLLVVNRSATARKLTVQGANHPWTEIERTGLEEENAVSAVPGEVVLEPGEIVVLSTVKAE